MLTATQTRTELRTVHSFPFDRVHANPYQTRAHDDPAHVQALAADMQQRGMLQMPLARPKPGAPTINGVPTEIELAFGHTRFAAWKIAFADQPFRVDVLELTDREMAEYAISENQKRKDISAIEKARALDAYLKTFGVTQKEAAALFGLSDASSVSNLLRLLKLPEPVQALVDAGDLPEQYARRLVTLAQVAPKDIEPLAQKVAAAAEHERAGLFDYEFESILRKRARTLDNWQTPFKPDWSPKKYYTQPNHEKGEPDEIPSCAKCPFLFTQRNSTYCLRPACYSRKAREYAWHEAVAACKKLDIPLDAASDHVVFDGTMYGITDTVKALVEQRPAHLRLVPVLNEKSDGGAYGRENALGSKYVALATTDPDAWRAALAAAGKAETAAVKSTDPAKQKEIERKEKEKLERERQWRAHMDAQADRIIYDLAHAWRKLMPANPALLRLMATRLADYAYMYDNEMLGAQIDLLQKGKIADMDVAQGVMMQCLLRDEYDQILRGAMSDKRDLAKFRKHFTELADALKVKLPKAWDAPFDEPMPQDDDKVDADAKAWLCKTPSNDLNFQSALKEANLATLQAALKAGISTKTAREAVEARIRKLEKANK